MNIFVLDQDPYVAATMMCDKHIVQMIRETAQLLSTAHRVLDGKKVDKRWVLESSLDSKIPQATHFNHPCAVWARQTSENFQWLHIHFCSLLCEYTRRYGGKIHFYSQFAPLLQAYPYNIKSGRMTEWPKCMPDECKDDGLGVVWSYRNFYIMKKSRFAKWKHSQIPWWWPNQEGDGFIGNNDTNRRSKIS